MKKPIALEGCRFGSLTVAGRDKVTRVKHGRTYQATVWLCRCDCGGEITVKESNALRSGSTSSCGCRRVANAAAMRKRYTGHQRLRHGDRGGVTHIINRIKRGAQKRGLEYALSRAVVDTLIRQPCHYCGVPPRQTVRYNNLSPVLLYNGLDRVDNAAGYTETNVVPCCGRCNCAKNDMTMVEFKTWLRRLAAYQVAADTAAGFAEAA